MRSIRSAAAAFVLCLTAAACGDTNCKNACDALKGCGLSSSGLSCDANCKGPDDQCAACLNDTACAEIEKGTCAPDCPNAKFTR